MCVGDQSPILQPSFLFYFFYIELQSNMHVSLNMKNCMLGFRSDK